MYKQFKMKPFYTSTFSWQDAAPDVLIDLDVAGLAAATAISFICQVGTENLN